MIVLATYGRHRAADPHEGASVYPACQNLLLAARALGFGGGHDHVARPGGGRAAGGCWACPDDVAVAATLCLGRPVGHHGPVRRRPVGELVFDDHWGRGRPPSSRTLPAPASPGDRPGTSPDATD